MPYQLMAHAMFRETDDHSDEMLCCEGGYDLLTHVWQKMMAWFWFSGLPSPKMTPLSVSRLIGSRTLHRNDMPS